MKTLAVVAVILLLGCFTVGSVSASLADGLVAYYPFNGNANDESGTCNNGIVHNASLTSDRFGNPNSAYSFAGNAYIRIPNSPSLSFFDEFTFSLWFRASVLTEEVLLAKSGDRTGLGIKQHDVGTIGIENGQFYSGLHAIYAGTVGANEWHMVTVTTGNGMIRAYLDASLQSEETRDAFNLNPAMVNEDLYLGMGPVAWYYYRGIIDDVRVYNRALSEAEIRELYIGMHLPLPEAVTSNGQTYSILQDYLQNSDYIYSYGFEEKGYLIDSGWNKNHLGFDFMADKETPVSALCGGTVVRINSAKKPVDKYVEISHTCEGKTFLAFYAHIDAASGLAEGQPVPDTLEIGKVADWGTNSHLHLAVFSGGGSEWDIYAWCRKDVYTQETLEGKTVRTLTDCTRDEPARRDLKDYYPLHGGYGWLGDAFDPRAKAYLYVPRDTVFDWGWRDPVDVLLHASGTW